MNRFKEQKGKAVTVYTKAIEGYPYGLEFFFIFNSEEVFDELGFWYNPESMQCEFMNNLEELKYYDLKFEYVQFFPWSSIFKVEFHDPENIVDDSSKSSKQS